MFVILGETTMDSLILFLGEFHFIRPAWLLGLLVLFVSGIVMRTHPPQNAIDDLVDPHLRSAVLDKPEQERSIISWRLPGLLLGLLILALAGPTWERLPQPLYQLQQGRVIVLSLAKSMDRVDMQPSRLQRATFKIEDLLASMPGVLTGLVGFAGDAFIVTPLSDDQDTISNLLQSLDSDTLPVQGIRADRGLEKARALLTQVQIDAGEVILVTDQASPLAVSMARELSNDGIRVSVLEVAPESDSSQRVLLESIAQSGRGSYVRITPDDEDIKQLHDPLNAWLLQTRSESSKTQRNADQWRDFGPWLLIPVLILSSLVFRKGLLSLVLISTLTGLLGAPKPALAFNWQSLWQRPDQQQNEAVKAYRNNDMPGALQGFAHDRTATGAYNRGNALANSEQLQAALEAYDEALRLQPVFEDARYNRKIVQAALEKKQQQDKQSSKPGDEEEQEQDQEEKQAAEGEQQGEEQPADQSQDGVQEEQDKPDQQDSQQADSGDTENNSEPGPENDPQPAEPGGEDGEETKKSPQQSNDSESDQETSDEPGPDFSETTGPMDEEAQALELMLRQVPDDPGALLRRKFKYQYQQQQP
jgi:Ca-activated chloride channel family protein